MQKRKKRDFLHGSLWDKILIFAIPLAVSGLLQQMFNAADSAIVGKFEGDAALAAVGSNGPMVNLIVNALLGLSIGTNAMIGKWIGTGEKERIRKAVHTSVFLALFGGIVIGIIGFLLSTTFLQWMKSPDDVIGLASVYLKIYFAGFPFLALYNFGAAILRSVGDSRRPFLSLTAAGILNVLLNLLFVAVFGLGVAGVAIATVMSNALAAGLVLWFLIRDPGDIHLDWKQVRFHGDTMKDIAKIGVPSGLQSIVFAISNIYIQTSFNSLGSDAMAASSAAITFENTVFVFCRSFSQACLTVVSQNFGAGNLKRCRQATYWCAGLSTVICLGLILIFNGFAPQLLGIFTDSPAVIELGLLRMRYCLVAYFLFTYMDVFGDAMRGLGYSTVPMAIILLGTCVFRVIWILTVFEKYATFMSAIIVYPLSWVLSSIAMFVAYLIVRRKVERRTAELLGVA